MKRRLTDLCLMAMMGTVMVVSKEALAFLPNVELVSLLTFLFQPFGLWAEWACLAAIDTLARWRCSCCWRACSTALAPGG